MDTNSSIIDFRVFAIETYSYCNRHCRLCPRTELLYNRFVNKKRNEPIKEFLEDKYVYSLFDQLVKLNFKGRVQMFALNEPLLDHRMPEFIKYAYEKGINVRITTNGDVLKKDPAILDRIVPYLKELSIGIYDYNLNDLDWQEKRNRLIDKWENFLTEMKYQSLEVRYSLLEKFKRVPRNLDSGFSINARCDRVNDGIYVSYDGNVVHCCKDNSGGLLIGNVKEDSIQNMLSSDERHFIRKSLAKGERWRFASCRDCLDSIPESCFANEPSVDRDGEILRLGLKYGLTRYPQPGTTSGWKAKDYLACNNLPATQMIVGRDEAFRFGDSKKNVSYGEKLRHFSDNVNRDEPYVFTIPRNKVNLVSKVHSNLVNLTNKNFQPGLPRFLMVGESRYVKSPILGKSILESIYELFSGRINFLHYPLACGSILSAQKYLYTWLQAMPDVFVYCIGFHDAKRPLNGCGNNVDINTFRANLEWMFRQYQMLNRTRVVLVTSLPAGKNKMRGKMLGNKWIIDDDDLLIYNEVGIEVALNYDIKVLDLFNLLSVPDGVSFSNPSKKIVAQVVKALSIKFEDYLGVSSQDKADKSEL